MAKKKEIKEDIRILLKTVYDDCVKEDSSVRERQIRQWRRLKLLWEGFNRVWFSEVAHDWRIWDETEDEDSDQSYYDKPVNILKAYLESIIAALSVTVPPIKCFPDDADNTLDLATARAGDKISQLVYRHNNAGLKWLHALFVHMTEGLVAFYTYEDYSKKYGTYDVDDTEDVTEETSSLVCSKCGFPLDSNVSQAQDNQPTDPNNPQQQPQQQDPNNPQPQQQQNQSPSHDLLNSEIDEFGPSEHDAELHDLINQGKEICPSCMELMDPELKKEKFITTRIVGTTKEPKGRICIESYGGLYVKIPNYCKKQKDLPYLIFSDEKDYSVVVDEYEDLHENEELIKSIKEGNRPGGYEWYAQWGRLSPQYQGEYPENVVTVNHAWIRPAKFNVLSDKEDIKKLKKLFPDGVKVTYVNEQFAEACNESLDDCWTLTENQCLDDCWTLTENPLSDFLHFDPIGQSLVSVQDITNDLISLILQTIEHGIGQTFADPAVLNFDSYEQTSVLPGGIFPTKPGTGKKINEGFYELRTATLSTEVMPFSQMIQSMGQTVSGALPSIFGGQQQGAGGDTASGYAQSKSGALQRLQNTWKLFTTTWKEMFGKVIPMYINLVKISGDERDVQRQEDGNFVNVMIRKAELEGKIGKVELEANENLPLTWTQRKDLMMTLMQATNPKIMEILNAPENLTLIHEALGLSDFFVPNEDDVIKQYDEIKLLLASTPIPNPEAQDPNALQASAAAGQPPPQPETTSVEIDPTFDNHPVEFEICRKWIISEAGRQAKMDNPDGYLNVLLHGKAHFQQIQQQQMQQAQAQAQQQNQSKQGNVPNAKADKTKDKTKGSIMEEGDVQPVA